MRDPDLGFTRFGFKFVLWSTFWTELPTMVYRSGILWKGSGVESCAKLPFEPYSRRPRGPCNIIICEAPLRNPKSQSTLKVLHSTVLVREVPFSYPAVEPCKPPISLTRVFQAPKPYKPAPAEKIWVAMQPSARYSKAYIIWALEYHTFILFS